MQEQVFLSDPGITVTSTKIEINGQTFATRNVGSVKVSKAGGLMFPSILAFFSLIAVAVLPSIVPGLAFLVFAVVWGWLNYKRRLLVLVSGGGEVNAMKSIDQAKIERVRSAISQAMAAR